MQYEFARQFLLLVFGVFWCGVILYRFRDDLVILRESDDGARKAAVAFVWALTVPIVAGVLIAGPGVLHRLIGYITG